MRSLTFPVRAVSRFNPLRVLANNMFASPFLTVFLISLLFFFFFFLFISFSRDVFRRVSTRKYNHYTFFLLRIMFKLVRNTSLLLRFNCKCGLFPGTLEFVFSLFIFQCNVNEKMKWKENSFFLFFFVSWEIFFISIRRFTIERRFLFNFS